VRLLVDEDLASRELIARLSAAFPGEVLLPDRESSDEEVWQRAQSEGAAIITGNVVDFLTLAREHPEHRGLLLVYRRNDPTTDLRASGIAAGLIAVASRYPDGIDGLILAVNHLISDLPGN
jgi:predicted nuclease of predicted toxin-antitoxin system